MRLLTKSQSKNLDKNSVSRVNVAESALLHSAAKCIFDYIENYNNALKKKLRVLILINYNDSPLLAQLRLFVLPLLS